jgi:hypothetical protein
VTAAVLLLSSRLVGLWVTVGLKPGAAAASRCPEHQRGGAVVQEAHELVELARRHGYRLDELVDIIESAS